MTKLKAFFAQFNITTHTLVAVWLALVSFYTESAAAHTYINGLAVEAYQRAPHWLVALLIGLVIPFITWYRKGLSTRGKIVTALEVTKDNAMKARFLSAQKLGGVALCAVLLMGTITGCTNAQVLAVVQDIATYAQAAEPIIQVIIPIVATFALTPGSQPTSTQLAAFSTTAQLDLVSLVSLCNAYTAKPTAGAYATITALVDKLVVEADAALLQANGNKDPTTERNVQVALASIDAIIHTIDGFVQTTQTQAQVKATANVRVVKLRSLTAMWSPADKAGISMAFHTPYNALITTEEKAGY